MKKIIVAFLLLAAACSFALALGEKPKNKATASLDFTLPDLSGRPVKLSDYRGKVVLLNFWASWCPPCRAEMPSMQKLHEKLAKEPFAIVAVNLDRGDAGSVKNFIAKYGYTFKVLLDSDGEIASRLSIVSIPTTYLIDKNGKVIDKLIGGRDWSADEYLNKFNKLIRGKSN